VPRDSTRIDIEPRERSDVLAKIVSGNGHCTNVRTGLGGNWAHAATMSGGAAQVLELCDKRISFAHEDVAELQAGARRDHQNSSRGVGSTP
jgi:hypothetical protein